MGVDDAGVILDAICEQILLDATRRLSDRGLARAILDPSAGFADRGWQLTDKGLAGVEAAARIALAERRYRMRRQ